MTCAQGYKIFALCDSRTGYTYAILPVSRSSHPVEWQFATDDEVGAERVNFAERCILELCLSLPSKGKGFSVAMNKVFSTRKVLQMLRARGIGAVGTTTPGAGEGRMRAAVGDTSANMGGCAIAEQMRSYYTALFRNVRSWMPFMIMMVEVAIINSFVIWKLLAQQSDVKTTSHYEFRLQLVERLLHQGRVEMSTGGRVVTRPDQDAAFVTVHAEKLTGGKRKRKRVSRNQELPATRFDATHPHMPMICADGNPGDKFPDPAALSVMSGGPGASPKIGY